MSTEGLSHTDLMRVAVAAEAVAAAAKAELDRRAREAHAAGDKAAWASLEGDVSGGASTSNDRLNITDPAALYAFLREVYPHNFQERTVTLLEPVNPKWVEGLLASWLPQVMKGTLDLADIPGVEYRPGGEYVTVSVRPKAGLKDQLKSTAAAMLAAGAMPTLPDLYHHSHALESGPAA